MQVFPSTSPMMFVTLDSFGRGRRSEEHTSELQSRLHLVCRLLLEKKKIDHTIKRSGLGTISADTISIRLSGKMLLYLTSDASHSIHSSGHYHLTLLISALNSCPVV